MSNGTGTSGIGGVRNLRAIFENKPSEDRSASPPSRGRVHSETSIHSRPVSKVRASFVLVERPDQLEEGQQWGLRIASELDKPADKNQVSNQSLDLESAATMPHQPSQTNDTLSRPVPNTEPDVTDLSLVGGLGNILKGSAFEASPTSPIGVGKSSTGVPNPTKAPTRAKVSPTTARNNGRIVSGPNVKSVGRQSKDATSLAPIKPTSTTKQTTNKDNKSVKSPSTRQVPAVKPLAKSPTSPRAPKTPVSPKSEISRTRAVATKPASVAEAAKKSESPEEAKTSPKLHREVKNTHLNGLGLKTARHGPSPPKRNGSIKEVKSIAPESKARSGRMSASLVAPTASSAARSGQASSLGDKSTSTQRDPPATKHATYGAPAIKKAPRSSLPPQTNGAENGSTRASLGKRAPNESFLARMMRPTASSAQKTHDKVAPTSPPQSKRAAPANTAKAQDRISLARSDDDKENEESKEQATTMASSGAETRDVEVNGTGKKELRPLSDITPKMEAEAHPNSGDAVDVSST